MADISRYSGGAQKKRSSGGKQNIAGSTQQDRSSARAAETRAANPASQPREQTQNRRAINLDTGSFQEEIPVGEVRQRTRRLVEPRARVGNWEVEPEDEGVRVRRRFSAGGPIKPPQGDFIEFDERGRKRRVSAAELNQPQGKRKRR